MRPKLYTLAIALLAYSTSLFSQATIDPTSFLRLQNFATGANSVHLAHGDLDGDGKPDIAVANFGSNTISIFRNTSSNFISLASKIDIATADKPSSLTIADLNKDGRPEIIAALQGSFVAIYKNASTPGNLSFEPEQLTPTPLYATSITSADIDNDTYPDIAVVNNQVHSVSIYSNTNRDGGINLQLSTTIFTVAPAMDVIFANINGDNKPELIVTNYYSSSISVFINESTSGNISFRERVDFTAETQPNTIRAGDLDGDGRQDLVVGNSNIYELSILINKGNGDTVDFAPKQTLLAGQTQYGIAIADLDNDGKNDITTGNFSVNTMSVLMNKTVATNDTVSFVPAYTYDNINSAPYDLIAVDLNNDGFKDLITASFPTQGYITVWYNNLAPAVPVVPSIESFSPMVGPIGATVTINGTGFSSNAAENKVFFGSIEARVLSASSTKLTVQVPAGAAFGTISVVRNGFVGYSAYAFNVTFAGGGGGVLFNVDFLSAQLSLSANNPRTIKFADLDGDNKPDIIFTQQAGEKLSIYRNTSKEGLISYDQMIDLPTGTDPFDITINDFDGDGKRDIAITNMNAGLSSTAIVYKNNSTTGNISFTKVLNINAGSGATGIISSDFNFDGKIDLSISAGNSGLFYYLKNISSNGNIAFETLQEIPNWNHSTRMIEGDIDGDGIADVVTVNFSSQSITININESTSGLPVFSTSTDINVGQFPTDVAMGDLDGDGKQDLLVANYGSNTISVLRNISTLQSPSFESALIETGKDALSVSLGDLDGDGKLEMIVASGQPGKVGIYKNLSTLGKIEFGEVTYYQTGDGPTDVACADIDGDGKIDMAVGNGYSAVTILRNTFGEPKVTPSGSNPVYGAIAQKAVYDSEVNTYQGQPYVQRHYEVTPVNNQNTATGTIKLYFRQGDFDAFNAHPDREFSLPMGPNDSAGIANLRVFQYHGTSTEGKPGTYSGSSVVIDPDDARIVWNSETQWWEVSFEVNGFSGFFVAVKGKGLNPPAPATESKLVAYPNPSSGRVWVKHPVSINAFIKIVDIRGNISRVVAVKNDVSLTEVRLYGLASGIYKIVWQNVNSSYVKTLMVK